MRSATVREEGGGWLLNFGCGAFFVFPPRSHAQYTSTTYYRPRQSGPKTMEVGSPVSPPADAPAAPPPPTSSKPLTEQLANALSQHDYTLALRVANDLEIDIQVCR